MEGKYEVTRTSSPIYNTEVKVDSVYLSFKVNIVIDKKTTSINLSAQYNSYMLIFDTNNTKSIEYNYGTYDESEGYHIKLPKSNNIYYMFVKNLLRDIPKIRKIKATNSLRVSCLFCIFKHSPKKRFDGQNGGNLK